MACLFRQLLHQSEVCVVRAGRAERRYGAATALTCTSCADPASSALESEGLYAKRRLRLEGRIDAGQSVTAATRFSYLS